MIQKIAHERSFRKLAGGLRSVRNVRARAPAVTVQPGRAPWNRTDAMSSQPGAAATAVAAASTVFAQQPGQGGAASSFYEKGNVRIRYQEVGSGFPLLVTPGGGLNSRISNWQTAVINAMEEFKNDFRCITMDQRNATGGESTGPIPVDNPWDAFADDQLGLMDHLGIRQFFFFGNCIGGSFALKLMERRAGTRRRGGAEPADRPPAGEART